MTFKLSGCGGILRVSLHCLQRFAGMRSKNIPVKIDKNIFIYYTRCYVLGGLLALNLI